MTIDNESRELLKQISQDFVMFTGASAPLAYRIETGTKLSRESFVLFCNKHYGNVSFINEVGTEVDRASAGDIWWKWDDNSRRVVDTVVMEPTSTPEHEGVPEVYNRWYTLRKTMAIPNYDAAKEDVAPFINHLMSISDGDQIGVMYFLNWLAQLYQFPDTKIPVAIMLYSQFGGVGKNLVQKLLCKVFGKPLVSGVSGKRFQSNFMDAIEHKRIIFINELARSDRADGYEDFKTQVSEPETQFEGKGRAAREVKNIAHYIITTNNIDALPLMQNDRRIAVLMTVNPPLEPGYYDDLVEWIDGPGAGIVANLLRTWQFPAGWNPYAPAPQTIAALTVQKEARNGLTTVLDGLIEECLPPFDKDIGRTMHLCAQLSTLYGNSLLKGMAVNNKTLPKALEALRAVKIGSGTAAENNAWCWRRHDRWAGVRLKDWKAYLDGKATSPVPDTEGADHE
ncbi:primase-helicase family protein [Pseudomonas sp. NPDC012596]|uniref:primase-helicase family protein n=1 Tax=Pseudomonas sp. NPDC012596 TaxID=3364419 RepID=UPI0036980DF4